MGGTKILFAGNGGWCSTAECTETAGMIRRQYGARAILEFSPPASTVENAKRLRALKSDHPFSVWHTHRAAAPGCAMKG
jgi:hypothetical protein